MFSTYWNSANTSSITPLFQSASEEPDYIADDDRANEDIVTTTWLIDEKSTDSQNEPNGDSVHHWKHVIRIDVYAQDLNKLLLFCDEINRILWEYAPNSSTRLVKSDTSNAEGDYFETSEISFERIEPENNRIDFKPSTSAILEIHFRKSKS